MFYLASCQKESYNTPQHKNKCVSLLTSGMRFWLICDQKPMRKNSVCFKKIVAKFKWHDNWFKMVNGCRRITWNINIYLPDHKPSCSGDCHIQNKLYIASRNTINVIYLKHINIIHSRKQKLLQTSSIYQLNYLNCNVFPQALHSAKVTVLST
jgi:hypothetical protein